MYVLVIYVRMFVYKYAHFETCMYANKHECISVWQFVCMYEYMMLITLCLCLYKYTCILACLVCLSACAHIQTSMPVYLPVHLHMYINTYMSCVCLYVCVCMYGELWTDSPSAHDARPPPLPSLHFTLSVLTWRAIKGSAFFPMYLHRKADVEVWRSKGGRGGSETQRTKLVDVCAFVCVRLRVCACVCVLSVCVIVQCVCRAICLHRCIDTHRVHMHARMYAHINACICVCMQHTCLYVCTYVCTYGCVHGFFVCVLYMYACTMHFAGQMSCLKFVMTLFSISCTRICMFTHVYIPFSHSIVLTLHTQPHVNRCTQIWKLLFGAGELLNGLDQVVLALHSSGQFGSYKGAVHHDKRRESTLEKIRNIRARFLGELMYFLNQFIYLFTWSGEQIQDRSASFLLQLTPCTQLAGTLAIYTSGCC